MGGGAGDLPFIPSWPSVPRSACPGPGPSRLGVTGSYWRKPAGPRPRLHHQALLADEEIEAQRGPEPCPGSQSEERPGPEQGARLVHLPHLTRDDMSGQILPGGCEDPQARALLQVAWPSGALRGTSAHTPGNIVRLFQKFQVYSELSFELP